MSEILRQYEEDGLLVTEYTRDGETVSAIIKEAIRSDPDTEEQELEVEPKLSSEEVQAQTLVNTEYLVIMSELANL